MALCRIYAALGSKVLNIRSITKNLEEFLCDFNTESNKIVIISFAETRLSNYITQLFGINNYNMVTNNRNRNGGGIAVFVRETFTHNKAADLCLMEAHIESVLLR